MVSRSLTEVYILMRNNAIHSRQIFAEPSRETECVELMRSSSQDLEAGMDMAAESNAPPPWADSLEEAHYVITRLKTKLSELEARHDKQIRRPSLDDTTEQQHIERLTAEIGRHFTHIHTHLTAIKAQVRHGHKSEQKLTANVVLALVTILQDLSIQFRTAQSNYLKSLTSRDERSKAFFEIPNFEELSLNDNHNIFPSMAENNTDLLSMPSTSGMQTTHFMEEDHINIDEEFQKPVNQLSQKQLVRLQEDNTKMVLEREAEVNKIVRSIVDLNDIFKDLAHMVTEQGTILDRIDYNIEQTQVQVHEGYKQLQKAERYQKKNRKMHCILILAVTTIILVILLIIVKS